MKIVVLDGYPTNPGDLSWAPLESFGELVVYDRTPPDEVVARCQGAQMVLINKVNMTAAVMDGCSDMKMIGVLGTGYNTVDTDAAKERDIVVCNVPAYSTDSVAQHTMALLLEICLQVGKNDASVHRGDWYAAPDYTYYINPLMELAGKTMGIFGMGNIGRRVARLAAAFGMRVIYHSRIRRADLGDGDIDYVDFDTLLRQSDVLSLHCPLTPETEGLIDAKALAKMKDGAILINTTRGPVLDEAAVAAALESGRLYGVGVDVLSTEPPRPDNPLMGAKNCVITQHIAWAPKEARARLLDVVWNNIRCFVAGKPQNVVNG
jgi:glycerate dehydrogenase